VQYASFWRRLSAYFVDFLLVAPILYAANHFAGNSKGYYPAFLVLGLALSLFAHFFMVWRFGGSPGKLLLGVRVVSVDGSRISALSAAMRHSIEFVLFLAASVASGIGAASLSAATYQSLALPDRAQAIEAAAPTWYGVVAILAALWTWSEFAIMLTNSRRQSLHDLMAKTVVVRAARGAGI